MTGARAAGAARRILAVGAAIVVAVLGLLPSGPSSSEPRRATFPPARPTKVLILGDSVLAGAASRYGPALPGRDVTVDSVVNRTTGQGADVLARRGSDWDVVVVLLGYNDGSSPSAYQPAANRILDQLSQVPRVVWLSLHEVRPAYVGVNQFLRAQATRRPNLRIADWNAVATANPGALAPGGIHLNGLGAQIMAGFVAQQVEQAEQDEALAFASYAAAVARQEHAAAQVTLLETMAANHAQATLLRAEALDQTRARAKAAADAAARARAATERARAAAEAARRHEAEVAYAAHRVAPASGRSNSSLSSPAVAALAIVSAIVLVGLGLATRAALARRGKRVRAEVSG